jgi:hypothetical protein
VDDRNVGDGANIAPAIGARARSATNVLIESALRAR